MEIRLTGGSEVFVALRSAGFKLIRATGDGYSVFVKTVAEVQAAAQVAFNLGKIS